ncbi:hypothetical protein [Rhodothermus marinus]|uniref:Uncharacterized protein n=1 Tax=Rhodothermus marinus (strain ATCC 43812 / DSM 4252 / R-10) TaxID=518766 RepID=D0MHB1_RHOM4|nr:hypothetical protein [Rhodothermus marinus]ACY47869.1 hypothetical protein Rmar_0975 [Rhodothermus marinus DSM 4252]
MKALHLHTSTPTSQHTGAHRDETVRRRPFEPPRLKYQGRLTEQTGGSFNFS